jgi:2-iminobutanoate/2-iminopropanoate deaminase
MSKTVRRSIEVQGLSHGHLPIPVASRVGTFVATGGIGGLNPQTNQLPQELQEQVSLMFSNLRSVVIAAGASCETIVKLTVWVRTADARPMINAEWIKMFPDPGSRPARHILNYDLPGGMLVQCEAFAIASQD